VPFHQYWLKLAHAGDRRPIGDYSLCTRMAHDGTFMLPVDNPVNDLAVFNWAVHFDAARFAAMLRDHAVAQGVSRIDDIITHVGRNGLSGHIDRIETQGSLALTADLFLDCTGFRSLLLGQALGWSGSTGPTCCPATGRWPCPAPMGGPSTGPIPPAPRARRDGNGAFPAKPRGQRLCLCLGSSQR
jgi:tryptophan halogenase